MGPTPSARHRTATPRPCRRTAMRPSPCDVVHSDSADAAGLPFTAANPAHACRAERLATLQRGRSNQSHAGLPTGLRGRRRESQTWTMPGRIRATSCGPKPNAAWRCRRSRFDLIRPYSQGETNRGVRRRWGPRPGLMGEYDLAQHVPGDQPLVGG